MGRQQLVSLFGWAALALSTPAPAQTWIADNGNGTYTSPLFCDEFSDPDLIRVGSDFYLTGTTMHSMPGLPVLRSRDLVNWTFLGYAPTPSTRAASWTRPPERWWGFSMMDANSVGRLTGLSPVTWTDGWPYFGLPGNLGRTPRTWRKPRTGAVEPPHAPYQRSDDFSADRLQPVWQWNHGGPGAGRTARDLGPPGWCALADPMCRVLPGVGRGDRE